MQITTSGLDIAKNVFQVHGIDAAEKVVIRKQLRRGQAMKFFEELENDQDPSRCGLVMARHPAMLNRPAGSARIPEA